MKKNELYVYSALSLAVLIPVPGRLAYGIIIVIMLYLLTALGILFRKLSSMFFEYGLHSVLIAVMLISTSVLIRQILIMISPFMAFVIGINIYVPALTAFILGNLYRKSGLSLGDSLKLGMMKCNAYSAFAIVFFFIRDFLGYGTITFPCSTGVHEIMLLNKTPVLMIGSFLATLPGGIVLLAVLLAIIASTMKRFEILGTSRRNG
ncbi:hypothetical protein [Treponema sp.]|uniref:hypothetical protein n=1 Tax=Treponema sp. TaxID=166 RepID=UPI003890A4B2